MGTSAPLHPSSPLSLPSLYSPLDDWFSPFPHTSSSSSSSSSPQPTSFLPCIPLDAFHLRTHASPFSPVDSPVISSNSASKDMPESPFNSNCSSISAMSNFSMPTSHPSVSSVPHHFPSLQGGFNPILKPSQQENTPSCTSSLLTSAEPASATLSASRSAGVAVTKVSKRRARINKKAPIAVLSADTSNFRAMVQQLTGIPPSHVSTQMWGTAGVPPLRPQPTRFAYCGSLPTLDTSACCLGHKQIFPFLQRAQQPLINGGACNNAAVQIPFHGRGNYDTLASSYTASPGLWEAMCNGTPSGSVNVKGNVKEISASNVLRECEQSFPRQSTNLFDSLLMSDDDAHAKSSVNAVDAWLVFDGGLTNHSPRVDLAKIAS